MKLMNSSRYIRKLPIPRLDQIGSGIAIIGSDHTHANKELLDSLTVDDQGVIISDPSCDPNILQEDW